MPSGAAARSCSSMGLAAADHHRVIAEILDEPVRLLLRPGAADHPGGAAQPGDLTGQGAHAAGRPGDEDRVPGTYFGTAHDAHPGGGSLGEVGGRVGHQAGVAPVYPVGVQQGVFAPAEMVFHQVAGREAGPRGGDDLAEGGPVQRLADLIGGHRHDVVLVHQRAHHGGDAHHGVAYQHLAGSGFRDRHLHDLEEVIGDRPLGAGGQADFAVCAVCHAPRLELDAHVKGNSVAGPRTGGGALGRPPIRASQEPAAHPRSRSASSSGSVVGRSQVKWRQT